MLTNKLMRPLSTALLACLGLGLAGHASAQDASDKYLFGDWNGTRTRLADEGITFDLGYGSEVAHNFTGGTSHLTRYTDQWKLGSTLDLDKLWGWKGATFRIMVTDRNGRNLGADAHIGNNQLIQEVYGRGQTWHLTEFSIEQKFFDGKLDWKFGRLPVGSDFAAFSCDFQNLTFCGAQPGNIVGDYWVNWPTSQWATIVKLNTTEQTYIQIGAYQVNPKYVDDRYARKNGWKLNNPGGTTGALIPLEFGWTPSVGGLPGSYKIGGWYNTSKGNDLYLDVNREPIALTGGKPLQRDSRYGGYINFEQQVSGVAGGKGTTVFLNISQADRDTSATDGQIALGMEYKGIFDRPNDFVGAALGATHANGRRGDYQRLFNETHPDQATVVNDGYEYVAEVFYNWSPIASINLRPNLQYILHPGGTSQNSNAFVLGLKTSVTF
ncbi:OprB family porin [Luteibacter rhizovicinus]|uniref:OprB family porin n=1 Tax=Luteibacter rhizovicinus TaxID=242606 RepID=A0A4R3YTZ7_9GAMM|nr:carbohydrate porin [Luteibacter rhizovicinus]TCV95912.1 OprB family porin [Luteibacter rhizovicinus]